jgi:hypothetical protein
MKVTQKSVDRLFEKVLQVVDRKGYIVLNKEESKMLLDWENGKVE